MRTDVHQHLLPENLIAALSRRSQAPRITNGQLHVPGEPPSAFDLADHDPTARASLADHGGRDRVLVALSSALGIEGLPPEGSEPLLDHFNRGTLELGEPLALDATIRTLGVDRLLCGSDRPVAAPPATGALGDAVEHALTVTNPGWAFSGRAMVAVLA